MALADVHWYVFCVTVQLLSLPRMRNKRSHTPFILTHTHAATITERLPGDHIKCDQWTLLKVLLGVLWVCGACLLHGVKVYWCQVFTASLVYCLICRDIHHSYIIFAYTSTVAKLYCFILGTHFLIHLPFHCDNIHKLVNIHVLTLPGYHASK